MSALLNSTPDEAEALHLVPTLNTDDSREDRHMFALTLTHQESSPVRRRVSGEPKSRHDYAAAFELIRGGQEALHLAEEHNKELEAQLRDMAHQHRDELSRAQAQTVQLEQRARAAERRADEAEGWLERLYQGITAAFSSR